MRTIAKAVCVSTLGLLGTVLLVAGKSTAGAAFVCSALLVMVPFDRFIRRRRPATGLRVALIAVLCIVAIQSIASTDIVPGQATSGYVFVDQVRAILQRFQENVFGKGRAR